MTIEFGEPFDGLMWDVADKAEVTFAIDNDLYTHGLSATCCDTLIIELQSGKRAAGHHDWDSEKWSMTIGHGIGSITGSIAR